jgi:geranylgeranyl diphosphate synthase type II
MNEPLDQYMTHRRALVEDFLHRLIGTTVEWPSHLRRAITYSLYPGGKRLRPVLAIAGYEALATVPDLGTVMPVAVALELIHTYTLIHDDLPAMDDDDTRRGKPTSHRVHGEALAILAGDALQTMTFQVLTDRSLYPVGIDPSLLLDIAHEVAVAAGEEGVVGGQSMDLGYEGEVKAVDQLAFLYAKKTGGLIRASVLGGARAAGAAPWQLKALSTYGDRLGLAFQITDDLIDESESPDKHPPKPRSIPSIVELLGVRATRDWCDRAVAEALQAIEAFDERAEPLREIARWLPSRTV